MIRLTPVAPAVAVAGLLLVVVGWALGGFPSPDGAGIALLLIGIGLGLTAELGLWIAQRPRP